MVEPFWFGPATRSRRTKRAARSARSSSNSRALNRRNGVMPAKPTRPRCARWGALPSVISVLSQALLNNRETVSTDMKIVNEAPRIWLITGVSSGLGLAFAQAALTAGHTVVGTVRNEGGRQNFEKIQRGRAHAVVLDVSDFASIAPAVARVQQEIGAIDVLV